MAETPSYTIPQELTNQYKHNLFDAMKSEN